VSRQWQKAAIIAVKIILIIFGLAFTLFGLFSGAQPGWQGILNNMMNALPGMLFLMVAIMCWWYPRLGGSVFMVLAILAGFFFNAYKNVAPLIILVLIPFSLGLLIFRSPEKTNKR
jgi:hypothetical protein